MKKSRLIAAVLILLAISLMTVSAKARPETFRTTDREVSLILPRLERNVSRFRNSLNLALVQGRIDQTRPQNDINSFNPAFENAIDQFRDRFTHSGAVAADVQNILQKASLVDGFMTRNRLNAEVRIDWTAVRSDLNAMANAYGITWQWNQQTSLPVNAKRSSQPSDDGVNLLVQRIDTGGDTFRSSLTSAFVESKYGQSTSEGNMNDAVRRFKNATDQLRNQLDAGHPVAAYVKRLLALAQPIDVYMSKNRLTTRAQNDWSTLRTDLDTLSAVYSVAGNLQNSSSPQTGYTPNHGLTGTYRLDSSRSDNPRELAARATRNLYANERQDVYDDIMERLESPEMLTIERHGITVAIASSLAPQATFEADGRERQEQLASGRSRQVSATLHGKQLLISWNGYKDNDSNVTFDASGDDHSLRVRRQVYSDRLTQPVVVDSVYERTADVAQWNVYNRSLPVLGGTLSGSAELFLREGQTLVAVLNEDLTTKRAKQGDRFTMTVLQPGEYEGAVIEGTVGSINQGGRLTGRSGMALTFDTIRLQTSQTYRLAGFLTSVRTLNGDIVKIDNEGSAQGDNQITQPVQRAGIGTPVGAIIGAIAGGGTAAAIGAIVDATGGAGSVYVQGKDDLDLPRGTEITIRTGAPR